MARRSANHSGEAFLVDKLKAFRVDGGKEKVLVGWAEFESQDDTWEPVEGLMNSGLDDQIEELRKDYHEKRKTAEEESDGSGRETEPGSAMSKTSHKPTPKIAPQQETVNHEGRPEGGDNEEDEEEIEPTVEIDASTLATLNGNNNNNNDDTTPVAKPPSAMVLPSYEGRRKSARAAASPKQPSMSPKRRAASTRVSAPTAKRSRVDRTPHRPVDVVSESDDVRPPVTPATTSRPILPGFTPRAQEMEEVKVLHIGSAPKKAKSQPWALVSYASSEEQAYLPVEFLRQHFPRPLVDYLLERVRFASSEDAS